MIIALAAEMMMNLLHVLVCSTDSAVDFRKPFLADFETWLLNEDTQPDIAEYLLAGLSSWFEDPFGTEPAIFCTFLPLDRQLLYNLKKSVGMPFFAALLRNHWLSANKHTNLPLNLADVVSAGQYASYIGAGKSFTSFGCITMQRYMNPTLTMSTGVQPTFPV